MTRSEVMSKIRSKGTRLEGCFRELAEQAGVRLARGDRLFGRPDFRVAGTRTVVFVNSCFWHGCRWHCRVPSSRRSYWVPKLKGNIKRQKAVIRKLKAQGYKVLVVWEHKMKRQPEELMVSLRSLKPRTRR
jgi:DNA mismatch endonuclease (patch repair protein)